MKELKKAIETISSIELDKANEKFPLFHSPHEGYAVIAEEIDEVRTEYELMKYNRERFWRCVKYDENAIETVEVLKKHAISCAAELVQVIAMCDKYVDSSRKKMD